MTKQSSDRRRTRYFRSFSALRHPVQPNTEIELSNARELDTYYEARFEKHDRLVEFIKHLKQVQGGRTKWTVMFIEKYDYWGSGCLKKRTRVVPEQPEQTWDYADNERRWSKYFDDLFVKWFLARRTAEPTMAEISLLLHEQFTELESEVFRAGVTAARDNQWVFETTSRLIAELRKIVLEIAPDASPTICAFALGEGELRLEGFDEAPLNLYGVVSEWAESQPLPNDHETVTILPRIDFASEGQRWATQSESRTITVAPVLTNAEGKLLVAFTVLLVAKVELKPEQIAVLNSISRRCVSLLQQIIESARSWEEMRKLSKTEPDR